MYITFKHLRNKCISVGVELIS